MSIKVQYSKLYEVCILHDFYLNQGSNDFSTLSKKEQTKALAKYDIRNALEIHPTESCERTLSRYRLVFYPTSKGFSIFAPIEENGDEITLELPLNSGFELSFRISLRNPNFVNFTNLRLSKSYKNVLYFSNENANLQGNKLFLTVPVQEFKSDINYESGDLRVDNAINPTSIFEAVRNIFGQASPKPDDWQEIPQVAFFDSNRAYRKFDRVRSNNTIFEAKVDSPADDLTNRDSWEKVEILTFQYATDNDCIELRPTYFNHELQGNTESVIYYQVLNTSLETVYSGTEINTDGAVTSLSLDLEHLKPGKYQLQVEDKDKQRLRNLELEFYLDKALYSSATLGLITIKNVSGSHRLVETVNNKQELKQPVYYIHFRNRSTHWRYIFSEEPLDLDLTALGQLEQEATNDKTRFVTTNVLPLTRSMMEINRFGTQRLLPNPAPDMIKPQSGKIYSEVYLTQ